MAFQMVMARAYRGEPWRSFLVRETEKGAYLVGPETLSAFEAGECQPVGFPAEDVFEFDDALFSRLANSGSAKEGRTLRSGSPPVDTKRKGQHKAVSRKAAESERKGQSTERGSKLSLYPLSIEDALRAAAKTGRPPSAKPKRGSRKRKKRQAESGAG